MKKLVAVSLFAVAALLVLAGPADAWPRRHGSHHHHRSGAFVSVGPSFWWGPYPYWRYDPWPYYVYEPGPVPEPVVVRRPPVYVEAPSEPEQGYWHYCGSARAYYPSVQTCPEAWLKVAPRSE